MSWATRSTICAVSASRFASAGRQVTVIPNRALPIAGALGAALGHAKRWVEVVFALESGRRALPVDASIWVAAVVLVVALVLAAHESVGNALLVPGEVVGVGRTGLRWLAYGGGAVVVLATRDVACGSG